MKQKRSRSSFAAWGFTAAREPRNTAPMIPQGDQRSQRSSKLLFPSPLLVLRVHKANLDPDPLPLSGRDPEMLPVGAVG